MTIGDNYMFATGESAAPRLRLLEEVYGPSTRMFLREAGLEPGFHVAEIGCGVGHTVCHLAAAVGPTGRVVAIDISAEQLAVARSRAHAAGLGNIEFIEASATSIPLETASMDLVYCRMLLGHLRQSAEALAEFKRLLKPGGILACEDMVVSFAFSSPESAVYRQLQGLAVQFGEKQGVDYCIGERLPQLVRSAGFEVQSVRTVQPAFFSGDRKRWLEYSIREAHPVLLKAGLAPDLVETLHREMEQVSLDENTLVAQPVMTQVLARRSDDLNECVAVETAYLQEPIEGYHRIRLTGVLNGRAELTLDNTPRRLNEFGDPLDCPPIAGAVRTVTIVDTGKADPSDLGRKLYQIQGSGLGNLLFLAVHADRQAPERLIYDDRGINTPRPVTLERVTSAGQPGDNPG